MKHIAKLALLVGLTLTGCPTPQEPDAGARDAGVPDVVRRDVPAVDSVVVADVSVDVSCAAPDVDGDGHRSIACGGDDCDDTDPHRFPGNPEVCGVAMVAGDGGLVLTRTDPTSALDPTHDEDCDPATFASSTTRDGDHDGDGFVDKDCLNTDRSGMINRGTDCQDLIGSNGFVGTSAQTSVAPADIHPSEPEVCNGVDDNCNGTIDEGVEQTFYPDCDGDMYGDATGTGTSACNAAQATACMGHPPVSDHTDCDDTRANVHPGAMPVCDVAMLDENCSGDPTLGGHCPCVTGTTVGCGGASLGAGCPVGNQTCVMTGSASALGPCSVSPTLIPCWVDGDHDGFAPASTATQMACTCPSGTTSLAPGSGTTDCDDSNVGRHPGATEVCDGVDNNCNGTVDDGASCAAGLVCYAGACNACNPGATPSRSCTVCGGAPSPVSGIQYCSAGSWTGCGAAGPATVLNSPPFNWSRGGSCAGAALDGSGNLEIPYTRDSSACTAVTQDLGPLPPGSYQVSFNHYDTSVLVTPSLHVSFTGVGGWDVVANSVGGWQTFNWSFNVGSCTDVTMTVASQATFYSGGWYRGGDWIGVVTIHGPY